MLWDPNILNIVKRSGNMSADDAAEFLQEYFGMVLETLSTELIDHHLSKTQTLIRDPKKIQELLDTLPAEMEKDPELKKKVNDALLELDIMIIKKFRQIASAGDIGYLQVYLKSKIKELDSKIIKKPQIEETDLNQPES